MTFIGLFAFSAFGPPTPGPLITIRAVGHQRHGQSSRYFGLNFCLLLELPFTNFSGCSFKYSMPARRLYPNSKYNDPNISMQNIGVITSSVTNGATTLK